MRYALQRLILAVPVLFGVSVLTFLMLHLVPGDPVAAMFIGQGGAESRAARAGPRAIGSQRPDRGAIRPLPREPPSGRSRPLDPHE